jgi:hypothetical protein
LRVTVGQFADGSHLVFDTLMNIFTIRLVTKQSFTNLRLFCLIPTVIQESKIFFTLFLVFDKNKTEYKQ